MTAPVPSSGLSAARVEEIEARVNAAPPGPWHVVGANYCLTGFPQVEYADANGSYISCHNSSDAEFIAHARTDIPDLLAEVRRLQGELAAAREETAQAVRAEREECAKIVDAQSQRERGWGNDDAATVLHDVRNLILFRSRSLSGETAGA